MQVTYLGGYGPDEQEFRGVQFKKGVAVDLPDERAEQFKGLSHFAVGEASSDKSSSTDQPENDRG